MMMQQQQPQQGYHHPQTLEEVRTLWIGDLQYWVDETYLTSCFSQTGEVTFSPSSPASLRLVTFVFLQFTALSISGLWHLFFSNFLGFLLSRKAIILLAMLPDDSDFWITQWDSLGSNL